MERPAPVRGGPLPMKTWTEITFERALFSLRWVLAPIYLGLGLSLFLLLFKFGLAAWRLMLAIAAGDTEPVVVGLLGLIDISLMANLILMVMFAGYENFVSRMSIADHPDRPDWMGQIGFSEIKLKLMSSIVAISAIHVLEAFMDITGRTDRELAWATGLHVMFVVSAVLLALTDRISAKG